MNTHSRKYSEGIYSFEEIVDKRLGLGRYQIIVVVLLGLIFSADGIEISTLSLILPILKNEWKISETLQGLLGTVLFLGLFIGSLSAGFFIDKIGRKKTLEYVSITQFILGIYSSTISNVYTFLLVRGIFGFLLGFIIPLIPTLCTETIPAEKRGKITVLVNISFSIGQFLASIIAWLCLDNMTKGNWRLMLIICSIPPLLVFIGSRRFLRESPRYVILTDSVENGISIMNEIVQINNDVEPFYKRIFSLDLYKEFKIEENRFTSENLNQNSKINKKISNEYFDSPTGKNLRKNSNYNKALNIDDIKNSDFDNLKSPKENSESLKYFNYEEDYYLLKRWKDYVLSHNKDNPEENEQEMPKNSNQFSDQFEKYYKMLKALFNEKYKKFTIGLWITWFTLNFTKYGLVYIFPFFLNSWDQMNQQQKLKLDGIKSLVLTTLGEGFSGIFAYYLVDSPQFGRKYTLALGQFISSIFILFTYFIPLDHGNYLIFTLFVARLFVKMAFAVLYPLTAEVYHTSLRTLGVSSSSATGRIGASLMPMISIKLFYINMWLPFLLYFFVGMLGLFGTLILPYDTQGKHLDMNESLITKNSEKKILKDF